MSTDAPLRIGFNPDFAPFSVIDDDKPSGLVIDRIHKVFSAAEIDCEFKTVQLSGLTSALADGDIDALAAIAITPARLEDYSFSKPLLMSGAAWFIPVNKETDPNIVPERIVTPRTGPLISQIKTAFPKIAIRTSQDYDDALQMTLYGNENIDAAALNWHVGKMLVENKYRNLFHIPAKMFGELPLAMAFKAGDYPQLLQKINKQIPNEWGRKQGLKIDE